MKKQKEIWEQKHTEELPSKYSKPVSNFAIEVERIIPGGSKILDLGCGGGIDSAFFASRGNDVLATDFSETIISNNINHYTEVQNLKFETLNLEDKFPFEDESFDVVYARLSLHYFTDEVTNEIFNEIRRVLKKDGTLAFICKSTEDPEFGKGKRIAENIYETSHIRHFFTTDFAKECLGLGFEITEISSGMDNQFPKPFGYIKAIAKKL